MGRNTPFKFYFVSRSQLQFNNLHLRIRVGVIFIALDEVGITEDGNGKGDNLGVGDGV